MVWEWSHTDDAYQNAQDNLYKLDVFDLYDIWSEIQTCYASNIDNEYPTQDTTSFNESLFQQFISISYKLSKDSLIHSIWEFMNDFRTCDNGGFNAHCCPYGCHTVSFDGDY